MLEERIAEVATKLDTNNDLLERILAALQTVPTAAHGETPAAESPEAPEPEAAPAAEDPQPEDAGDEITKEGVIRAILTLKTDDGKNLRGKAIVERFAVGKPNINNVPVEKFADVIAAVEDAAKEAA